MEKYFVYVLKFFKFDFKSNVFFYWFLFESFCGNLTYNELEH